MKKTLSIICLILVFFLLYFLQSNVFTWFNIAGIMPNLYVILGEILSKNFSKDSRFIVTLMVIIATIFYETLLYILTMLRTSGTIEILPFIRILLIETLFNVLLTIIIYPIMKKAGYYLENLFDDKFILTRYF